MGDTSLNRKRKLRIFKTYILPHISTLDPLGYLLGVLYYDFFIETLETAGYGLSPERV